MAAIQEMANPPPPDRLSSENRQQPIVRLPSRFTMAYQTPTVDSLRKGLISLPQELFDNIYDFVFVAPAETRDLSDRIQLREDYNLLHIDRTSRASFAKSYYNAVFDLPADEKFALKWLRLLPKSHRSMLKRLVFVLDQIDVLGALYFRLNPMTDGWTIKDKVRMALGREIAAKVFTRFAGHTESFSMWA